MMERRLLTLILIAVSGLANAQTAGPQTSLPNALTASGDEAVMTLSATGVQIYECRAGAGGQAEWAFKEPRADLLLNGRKIGRHYAGPTWEHEDGSLVVGKVAARADAPRSGDIPWLRLDVTIKKGAGIFKDIAVVQRVATQGGTLSGACPAIGQTSEVPYASDYVMVRRP